MFEMYIYLNALKYAPSESCTRDGDNGQNSWYFKVLNTWMHFSVLIIIKKKKEFYRKTHFHTECKNPSPQKGLRLIFPELTHLKKCIIQLWWLCYLTNETQIRKTMILKRKCGEESDQSVSPNFRGVQSKVFNLFFQCFCLKLMSWLVWRVNLLNPNI